MKNYEIKTDIEGCINEDCTLIIYIWDVKKSIVCDIQKYSIDQESDDINHFIDFLTTIEQKYNLEEITRYEDIGLIFDTIEPRFKK